MSGDGAPYNKARYDVIGHGLACVDDLLLLSNIPGPEGRARVLRREQHGGGMAATAVVAVARLGGRAGFVTKVGDDPSGKFILEDFRRYGVDVSRIVVEPGATSHLTVVLVDAGSGARSFLGQRGTIQPLQPAQLDRDYLTSATILHVSDADPPALQAVRWAKAAGREVCFDGTHFYPAVLDLIPAVDYLIVSHFFASEFVAHQEGRGVSRSARMFAAPEPSSTTPAPPLEPAPHPVAPAHPYSSAHSSAPSYHPGANAHASAPARHGTATAADPPELSGEALLGAAERLAQLGPPVVVVTEGERGSWCVSPEGQFHTLAFPVAAVDTTGAGDVFHGAFLYARSRGWDLRPALRLASATAALKCRALGGRAGIPSLEEALALAEG